MKDLGYALYGFVAAPTNIMRESTPQLPDELDAGWDDSKPTHERLHALVSSPAIADIDDGWDLAEGATNAVEIDWAIQVNGSGTPAHRGSNANPVPPGPRKKQLRLLERQARAHQLRRNLESRASRKNDANSQQNRQRDARAAHHSPDLTHNQQGEGHCTMSNPQPKATRRKAKAAKGNGYKTGVVMPESAAQAAPSSPATATNRAMRRAKTAPASAPQHASVAAGRQSLSKRPAIGPFALFIGVVLVASIFSYLFIR